MYLEPFKHTLPNGVQLLIEAAVEYKPALNSDKHSAESRDDLLDDLEVIDLLVVDSNGNDVTEVYANIIPKSAFLRELEMTSIEDVDLSTLTIHEGYEDYT